MTKEQVAKMSIVELQSHIETLEQNLAKMKALNVDDLVILALCKSELKQRKENGNC